MCICLKTYLEGIFKVMLKICVGTSDGGIKKDTVADSEAAIIHIAFPLVTHLLLLKLANYTSDWCPCLKHKSYTSYVYWTEGVTSVLEKLLKKPQDNLSQLFCLATHVTGCICL